MYEILYQDRHVIAVNKPAGLLSVPGKGIHKQDSIAWRMQQDLPQARIVHRLDCHTSGVMLMAIGDQMQRALNKQFHDRQVDKYYVAVVNGVVNRAQGIIDMPMRADPDHRPLQVIDCQHGKQAITHWQIINVLNNQTRMLLKPITGRTHQLRLHCMVMGHSIVGDRLYELEATHQAPRMLLHAEKIVFTHPVSNQRITVTAACDF